MPARQRQSIRHVFGGGWATDYGQEASLSPAQAGGAQSIPFLVESLNNTYELDGGPHKIGGTVKSNSTVIVDATTSITGLYDYWQHAGAAPSQKLICNAGTSVYSAAVGGDFTKISGATALTLGATPSYETFDDLLIISSDTDVPYSCRSKTPPRRSTRWRPRFVIPLPASSRVAR